jgi:type I restriction enzyme S subunit
VLNQHIFKVGIDERQITLPFALSVFARLEEDIAKQAHGFKASFVHVKKSDLVKVLLPLPPLPEQCAIAEALSDVDALLTGLDRLIAKKRDIKQAAMQHLLTGHTRLPGFQGEWALRTLEETTECLDGLRVPLNESQRATMRGDIPYCGANGVLDFVNCHVLDDDVILMAEDGGYFDEYKTRPIAYRMSGKCWVNNHAHILKARPNFDQDFIFYSLVHKNILLFLANGTRAKLNKSEMNKITIALPIDKSEQTAIATVLSDMDAELAALEARRDKTRALKQGMMQELLTGRTRLV